MQMRWRWPPENSWGVAVLVEGLQAAVVHDLVDVVVELGLGNQVMLAHRLADDLTHGQAGRQAGERVLEDDLHLGTQRGHLLVVQVVDLLAVEQDLAVGLVAGQAQDGAAGGGFAAAGLAHQAHGAAAAQVEGDAVHSLDLADGAADQTALDGEVFLQVIDHQDILGVVGDRGVIQLFALRIRSGGLGVGIVGAHCSAPFLS